MKKLLTILAFVPVIALAQINIQLESHTFKVGTTSESHCYYGISVFENGYATFELKLYDVVRIHVISAEYEKVYTIDQDGIYDINLPVHSKRITIIFTDSQGIRYWWYT